MASDTFNDWQTLVEKQLKTQDIYAVLTKENLEDVSVKPYYTGISESPKVLKFEESTHLVCRWYPEADENAFAFLVEDSYSGPGEKTIFVSPEIIENDFQFSPENRYFSLIDPFNDGAEGGISNYIFDKNIAERLVQMPFERPLCVDIAQPQNAGASIIQQLAIALLKISELFEILPEISLKQVVFRVAVGANYFFEIAKLRALKILLTELQKEYGKTPEIAYFFAETSHRNKTKSNPENNLIRSTLEIGAAMVAGADAVFANNYHLTQDTALVREISFKQSVVLAYESILNVFEDGATGSFAIEDLTRQFSEKAWALFADLENCGGYLANLQNGNLQKMIADHAIEEQKWVENGKIKLIGVNAYPALEVQQTVEKMYDFSTIKPVRWAEQFGD